MHQGCHQPLLRKDSEISQFFPVFRLIFIKNNIELAQNFAIIKNAIDFYTKVGVHSQLSSADPLQPFPDDGCKYALA